MKRRALGLLILLAVAALAVGAGAWEADFDPTIYNPAVGEPVEFAVCETCLEAGASFGYAWDFDGDGVVDLETDDGVVQHTFDIAGYVEVSVTVSDAGGRSQSCRKGILVGVQPAIAVREILSQSDGTYLVLITIDTAVAASAIGFQENMARGWQLEIVDAGGSLTYANAEARMLEVLWGSEFEAGTTLTFSYRLHPAYDTSGLQAFYGVLSGYSDGERFSGEICGDVSIP
jgi:hypothetical protein